MYVHVTFHAQHYRPHASSSAFVVTECMNYMFRALKQYRFFYMRTSMRSHECTDVLDAHVPLNGTFLHACTVHATACDAYMHACLLFVMVYGHHERLETTLLERNKLWHPLWLLRHTTSFCVLRPVPSNPGTDTVPGRGPPVCRR